MSSRVITGSGNPYLRTYWDGSVLGVGRGQLHEWFLFFLCLTSHLLPSIIIIVDDTLVKVFIVDINNKR